MGLKASEDARKKLVMCNEPKLDAYLTQVGNRLAAKTPTGGVKYPFEFHCVNDKAINAFALPGGYVFVNRGTIEAARNEAQLAAVMAHELSHVVLRHGTSQASKSMAAQLPIAILGGVIGGSSSGALITELSSFTAGSVLLKYSRTAESQADVMGTQILYDAGYDPRAMAQFFETLEAESKGRSTPEFFSDHPSPENRIERVNEEIPRLGPPLRSPRIDTPAFQEAKRLAAALPVIKTKPGETAAGGAGKPPAPSGKYVTYQGSVFSFEYPENWKQYGQGDAISLAPEGGVVRDRNGQEALAYGIIVNLTEPQGKADAYDALEVSTEHLIDELQHSNPSMRVTRPSQHMRLNGQRALSTYLSNDSPAGGQEKDWVVTVMRPEGILYFVCAAPQEDFSAYEETFSLILESVRFTQ